MVNIQVLKTPQGFLKVIHVALGVLVISINGHYVRIARENYGPIPDAYFVLMLVSFAFLVTSFLLLVSVIMDESADNLGKSHFEVLYHLFGLLFYFSTSNSILAHLALIPIEFRDKSYVTLIIGALFALLNSIAYGANVVVGLLLRKRQPVKNSST